MTLKIIRDKQYNTVIASQIHGRYPYKLYLEIKGNSNIGRYIVVVSDRPLNSDEAVDEIIVQLVDKVSHNNKSASIIRQGNRPNMVGNEYYLKYKVKETSILNVKDSPLMVFKPVK